MSILFVTTMIGDPWGASEELWSQTAAWLHDAGEDVHVSLKQSSLEHPIFQQRLAGKVRAHPRRAVPSGLWARAARRLGLYQHDEFDCLQQKQFDLVLISCAWQYEGLKWAQACRSRGIPYALLVQHAVADVAIPGDQFRLHEALPCFESARRCYFVSRANLTLMQHQLAWNFSNASVVRSPFGHSNFAKIAWPDSGEFVQAAMVARWDPLSKGIDLLFQVLAQSKWKSRPLKVSLFGEGPHEQYLRRLLTFYDLTRVQMVGFVNDIGKVWRDHALMILPSRSEGLPLAVAEAMLCGRPCIVSPAAAGMGELVIDGENGFVARAASAEALDEALERAWICRAMWPEMGQRAAAHAAKVFPGQAERLFAQELLALAKN